MNGTGIARRLGISTEAVEQFIQEGAVPETLGSKIGGASTLALQQFVDGGTSITVASRLGCSAETVQELRNLLGRDGAIGLLLGLSAPTLAGPREGDDRQKRD